MVAPWLAVVAVLELAPPVLGPPEGERPVRGSPVAAATEGTGTGERPAAELELAPGEAWLAVSAPAAAPYSPPRSPSDPAAATSQAPSDRRDGPRVSTTAFATGGAPPCSGDVCQPRVSVPGFEPRFDTRGKRTELVLLALDRAHVEPLATIVWALAATGLRLDYTPPQFDAGLATGHGGWGHVQLLLRWRIDAMNAPVWPVRHR